LVSPSIFIVADIWYYEFFIRSMKTFDLNKEANQE
jgi:hypothetical protein